MVKISRRMGRHVAAAILIAAAVFFGFVPFIPGVVLFLAALVILSIDYRIIRGVILRPLRRMWPSMYAAASRNRRALRLRWFNRRGKSSPEDPAPDSSASKNRHNAE